jgi:competence protein ComEC
MGHGLYSIFMCFITFFAALVYPTPIQKDTDSNLSPPTQVIFHNVGQGDFISLTTATRCLLFDAGGSHKIYLHSLKRLHQKCKPQNTHLYLSHFDKDHLINYQQIFVFLKYSKVFISHSDPKTKAGKNFLEFHQKRNIPIQVIDFKYQIKSSDFSLECLWPQNQLLKPKDDENSKSLTFLLSIKGVQILLTGDLPSKMEKKTHWPQVDILKVGHHGSKYSSSLKFLRELRAKTCVVSAGKGNSYHHPHNELLHRLEEVHCGILRTDLLGQITLNF